MAFVLDVTLFCAGPSRGLGAQEPGNGKPVAEKPVAEKQVAEKQVAELADAAARTRPVAPTIGVVDIVKVFDQYPKAIKERERLGKRKADYDARIDQLNKRLDEIKATIPTLKKDSLEYRLKVAEYRGGLQQREDLGKVFGEEYQLEMMRSDLDLFADIEFAVAQVAKDRGLQLVLRTYEVPGPGEGDDEVRMLQVRSSAFDRRQVWFASGDIDITPAVIKFLQVPLDRPAAKPANAGGAAGQAAAPNGDAGAKKDGVGDRRGGE